MSKTWTSDRAFCRTARGGYFNSRPYYPVILANGTDAVLVNPEGAPCSRQESFFCILPMQQRTVGWFKTDRRYTGSDTHYGAQLCLADIKVSFLAAGDCVIPWKTQQAFDPRSATVTTTFRQFSQRAAGDVRVTVTTFLTDEHVLVMRCAVLNTPVGAPVQVQAFLAPPFDAGTCENDERIHARQVRYHRLDGGAAAAFTYRLCGYKGVCALWGKPAVSAAAADGATPKGRLSPPLRAGGVWTLYAAVLDSVDTPRPLTAMAALIQQTTRVGYRGVRRSHAAKHRNAHAVADVQLPDAGLQFVYDVSHYVLGAYFDRASGFLPMGLQPMHWQNCMFWDAWFCAMAWLGWNRLEAALTLARFWKARLPEARQVARRLQAEGARFAWDTRRTRFTRNPEQVIQFHNNGAVAIQIGQVWQADGRLDFLREMFPVLEDAVRFLVSRLTALEHGRISLVHCAGPDESVRDQKRNDTWTIAVLIKSLDLYLRAARALGREPFRPNLIRLRDGLWTLMNKNVDRHGVLQSFEGGRHPHWGSLIFHLFPEHSALAKTLAAISTYDAELDGYQSHGVSRYPSRVFPWGEYWLIRILADRRPRAAWARFLKNAKFTNCFGGIPERVFMHGELYIDWFLTGHAGFLWALRGLLVQRRQDCLHLFRGLPSAWKSLSFRNLTTEDGLRVSAELKNGRMRSIRIVNTHQELRRINLATVKYRTRFVLPAGQTWQWPQAACSAGEN